MKRVVILVSGGVAEVSECPNDVEVLIKDFDNDEEISIPTTRDPVRTNSPIHSHDCGSNAEGVSDENC